MASKNNQYNNQKIHYASLLPTAADVDSYKQSSLVVRKSKELERSKAV